MTLRAAYVGLLLAMWTLPVAALDRQGAIDVAKRQVSGKCSTDTPCTYDAKQEGNKWHVRVEFTRRKSPQDKPAPYKGGHAIFIIDQGGKVIGRVEGKQPERP